MVDMSYEGKGTSTAGVQKKFVITHRSVTKLDKTFQSARTQPERLMKAASLKNI